MSWMAKLYETYECALSISEELPQQERIMPISHTLQNAHINIVLDGEGNFLRAKVLEKIQIVLPATEKSAGRGNGINPHPLADKIQYVAADYPVFGGSKKSGFAEYKALLTEWCESEFSHCAVQAVLKYISKGVVVTDLVEAGVILAENGKLKMQLADDEQCALFKVLPVTAGAREQGGALVCWSVEIAGKTQSKTWLDSSIQQSWINFDGLNGGHEGLCFVTGKDAILASTHPSKIRHTGDKTKLISGNDLAGFTFRGRFTDNTKSTHAKGYQAAGVGFDVTQKAHNALRWLVTRQGFRNGDQAFVAWAVSGKKIPQPTQDPWSLFLNTPEYVPPESDHVEDLGKSYAKKLSTLMAGYLSKGQLVANESIVIMGIDSTSGSNGRLSIIYYRETIAQEFIDTLTRWHQDFAWWKQVTMHNGDDTTHQERPSSPLIKSIATCAYGHHLNEALKKSTVERLIPCIIDGQALSQDILSACIKSVANPFSKRKDDKFSTLHSEKFAWLEDISITCALYKGYYLRHPQISKRKKYLMALEMENNSRDYLFGRLLAIAEKIESVALSLAKENRLTTAERLFQRFSARPTSTWANIENSLSPYQQRLKSKLPPLESAYKKLLDEVLDLFQEGDFIADGALKGEYLLGYHCQRKWLNDNKLEKGVWVLKSASTDAEK
jgi:CRISPR-associated protein Csd1